MWVFTEAWCLQMPEVAGSDGHDAHLGESDTHSAANGVVERKWKTSLQLHIREKSGQNHVSCAAIYAFYIPLYKSVP